MRSRVLILATLVGLVAVVLVIAVAGAGAGQSDPLPDISAPDLLGKMAQAGDVTAVSGDVAWQNDLFGDLAQAGGMAQLPAQSPLTSSGSGRIWMSDAGARVESQGGGGDQVVVVNKAARTAWVYDYAQNTVKKVVVTGTAPVETPSPAPDATALTPAMITLYLQQVARFATVEVAGQTKVAGRDAYQLRMTPVAADTALGYVEAAVDGETMLPLQLDVYARGGTTPVLRFGFTSVSYDAIDPATFTFTPPEGATVTTKTVDGDEMRSKMQRAHEGDAGAEPTARAEGRRREGRARRAAHARAGPGAGALPAGLGARLRGAAVPLGLRPRPGRPADGIRRAAHGADGRRHRHGLRLPGHEPSRTRCAPAPRRPARAARCSTATGSAPSLSARPGPPPSWRSSSPRPARPRRSSARPPSAAPRP